MSALLLGEVHLSMGGHSIACLTGPLIFLFEELAGTPGKRADALMGKAQSVAALKAQSTRARRLYVPMYFFFCSTRGSLSSALNIVGSQFQRVYLDMQLNSLSSVVENGTGAGLSTGKKFGINAAADAVKTIIVDPISLEPMVAPVRAGGNVDYANADKTDITTLQNIARVSVDTHGITLSETERSNFSSVNALTLMNEVHILNRVGSNALNKTTTEIDVTTFAKNLVYEIIVAARLDQDGADKKTTSSSLRWCHRYHH